jgi:hypothetical protein
MKSRMLASLTALAAMMVAAPSAHADHIKPNLGIEVTSVDPATRTVVGIQHCTSPERAGRPATFTVTPDITFDQFQPGVRWGIAVGPNNVILSTGDMPCDLPPSGPRPGPAGPGGAPIEPGAGPGGAPIEPGAGPDAGVPTFSRGLMNRVWKFEVEVDSVQPGRLEVTIGKVLNLPARFRTQEDELVDAAAVALFDAKTRVYEGGQRVHGSRLEDADGTVRLQGKLLSPQKWAEDEDGDRVPTIRVKKVFL